MYEGMLTSAGVVRMPSILVTRDDAAIPFMLTAKGAAMHHYSREDAVDLLSQDADDAETPCRDCGEIEEHADDCPHVPCPECGEPCSDHLPDCSAECPDDARSEPDDWYEQVGRY